MLPMPRQYGIGRRAPTRAVLLTFCYVSSRKLGGQILCGVDFRTGAAFIPSENTHLFLEEK